MHGKYNTNFQSTHSTSLESSILDIKKEYLQVHSWDSTKRNAELPLGEVAN